MVGYDEDLAHVHMQTNSHGDASVPGIRGLLESAGIRDGLIVDLGCGDGRVCAAFARAGYQAHGIDLSEASIAFARDKWPDIPFEVGSFLSMSLPSCRAITALGEVFNYAFDSSNGWPALTAWFERAFEALEPAGLLIFDVAAPGRCPETRQVCHWGDGWAFMAHMVENPETRILTRDITVFRRVGALYRRSDEVHKLHLYEANALLKVLHTIGFEARIVDAYGDYRFPFPGWVGFIAQKPNPHGAS
jgi:SAM-dependent methyltransferase